MTTFADAPYPNEGVACLTDMVAQTSGVEDSGILFRYLGRDVAVVLCMATGRDQLHWQTSIKKIPCMDKCLKCDN